jgi:hypothetical protein
MASRKEQKEAARREREQRELERATAERRSRIMRYGIGGTLGAVAAVAVIVLAVSSSGGSDGIPSGSAPKRQLTDLAPAAAAAKCQVKDFPNFGNQHTTAPVSYKSNPPTSGPHDPVPAQDGEYASAPGVGHTVHSLEHGRIDIQFKPSAPKAAQGALKAVFEEDSAHMLLFPNQTQMPDEVAVTAWQHALVCPRYNARVPDAVRAFRDKYRDHGPESVP